MIWQEKKSLDCTIANPLLRDIIPYSTMPTSLQAGKYMLRMVAGNYSSTAKFVVEKITTE